MAMSDRFKGILLIAEQDFDEKWNNIDSFIASFISSHRHLWFEFLENFSSIYLLVALFIVFVSIIYSKCQTKRNSTGDLFLHSSCSKEDLNHIVVTKIKQTVGSYKPPLWYSPHLGTLIPFGKDLSIAYHREIMSNEGSFAVDWFPSKPPVTTESSIPIKIILFFPGLGLSSKNKFCKQFVNSVAKENYHIAVVNARGMELPLKSSKLWHPGLYADAKFALEHVVDLYPRSQIFLVGYSAGSNILQKLLRHKHANTVIAGGMCVCATQDYFTSRQRLESTVQGRIYSYLMTLMYKNLLNQNQHIHGSFDANVIQKVLKVGSMSEFDDLAAEGLYGFTRLKDYYMALSNNSFEWLDVPLLVMQPADDPLHQGAVRENINVQVYLENSNLIYFEPQFGNHFGFYEGRLWEAFSNDTSYTYPAKVALAFFNTILEKTAEGKPAAPNPSMT